MFNHMSKISFSWLRERGREIFCGDDPWEWLVVWARSWLWLWLLTFSRTQIYCRHPSLGIRGPIYPPHSLPPHYLTSSTLICPPPPPHILPLLHFPNVQNTQNTINLEEAQSTRWRKSRITHFYPCSTRKQPNEWQRI